MEIWKHLYSSHVKFQNAHQKFLQSNLYSNDWIVCVHKSSPTFCMRKFDVILVQVIFQVPSGASHGRVAALPWENSTSPERAFRSWLPIQNTFESNFS